MRRPSSVLWVAIILLIRGVYAHPTPYSQVMLTLTDDGADVSVMAFAFDFAQELKLASEDQVFDPAVVGADSRRLVELIAARLIVELDGATATAVPAGVSATSDRKALTMRFRLSGRASSRVRVTARFFPYDPVHETLVTFQERGRLTGEAILTTDHPSADHSIGQSQAATDVIRRFVAAGVTHIAIGPDHVLFLIGLLLLGGGLWPLVRIVTGFTIGHSLTLSLAVLNLVTPPVRVIEPAIALSICIVGIDNLLRRPGAPDRRAWMAFGFGLMHGFGFANVLREMDLPRAALGWSLLGFNLGVELGQLLIVVVVAGVLAWIAATHAVLRRRITVAGSVAVLWAGVFWLVQRLFFA